MDGVALGGYVFSGVGIVDGLAEVRDRPRLEFVLVGCCEGDAVSIKKGAGVDISVGACVRSKHLRVPTSKKHSFLRHIRRFLS